MRYFLDTEFIELGHTRPVQLLSIGLVSEDGRELYAETDDADRSLASKWVQANVFPYMTGVQSSRQEIAKGILDLVGEDANPEFWAYFADYDWVVFCQIFGLMIDLPDHFPKFCRDLKQLMVERGFTRFDLPEQKSGHHNALADAKWVREAVLFLEGPR